MDIYFRPTRSGKKHDRQPKARDYKQSTLLKFEEEDPEHVPPGTLTGSSVSILSLVMGSMAQADVHVSSQCRGYVVIRSWDTPLYMVTACVIEPDVSTCMVSVRGCSAEEVSDVVRDVSSEYPDFSSPSVQLCRGPMSAGYPLVIQLSGKLAPIVTDRLREGIDRSISCTITFCNLSRSRILFWVCESGGGLMRTLGRRAIEVLKPHFPPWSGCIRHMNSSYYKIVCNPEDSVAVGSSNNSCAILYVDGRVRFQGTLNGCSRAARAISIALDNVVMSSSFTTFMSLLMPAVQDGSNVSDSTDLHP